MRIFKIPYLLLFTIIMLNTGLQAQEAGRIAFGPYLQKMTYRSVTICWSTLEGKSIVTTPDGISQIIPHYKQHQIKLPRLKEKSTYQ